MALPFSPAVNKPARSVEVQPDHSPTQRSQEIHPPNFAHQVGDALLLSALAVLPEAYRGLALREGTYIQSDANVIFRDVTPEGNLVVIYEQREGGELGYIFPGAGAVLDVVEAFEAVAEVGAEAAII